MSSYTVAFNFVVHWGATTLQAAAAGQPPSPHEAWGAWNWDPFLLAGLSFAVVFYTRGVVVLWRRAGAGRAVSYAQAAAFYAGVLAVALALISPIDATGEALLSAHMVQHLLLMLVAAPLLVAGTPPVAAGWALPHSSRLARWWHRRRLLPAIWNTLSHPALAWFLYAVTLWLWHLPRFYEAALLNEGLHIFEHITFLAAALLFWWTLLRRRDLGVGAGVLYVFTTALHGGLLGVLLTFAPAPWYAVYGALPYAWGLTPLQDQQLAGVIMWFPGGIIYLVATLLLLGFWLHRRERREGRRAAIVRPRRRPVAET